MIDDASDRVIFGDGRGHLIENGGDHASWIDVLDFDSVCRILASHRRGNVDHLWVVTVDHLWVVTFLDPIDPDRLALVAEKEPLVVSHG